MVELELISQQPGDYHNTSGISAKNQKNAGTNATIPFTKILYQKKGKDNSREFVKGDISVENSGKAIWVTDGKNEMQ